MKRLELIIFLIVLLFVYLSVFGPLAYQNSLTPQGATFSYAGGYLPDYYQYLGWIKDGEMGHVLLSSRYTEVNVPRAFIHPLFSTSGLLGNLLGLDTLTTYLLLRLLSTGIFLMAFYWFIKKIFVTSASRILALIAFVSATSFWPDPIAWSGNFNALYKFYLPPQHLLALSMTLLILGILIKQKLKKPDWILLAFSTLLIGLLNPSSLVMLLIVITVALFLGLKNSLFDPKRLIPLYCAGILILLYDLSVFQSTPPWSVMYERMKHFNPPTTIVEFILAVGPLGILGLFALPSLFRKFRLSTLLLFVWAYIPFFLFPFRERIGINTSRLFQTYQFIPLGILSVISIESIATVLKRVRIEILTTKIIFVVLLLLYASVPYYVSLKKEIHSLQTNWFNVYIPNDLTRAFHFLDTQTPSESVVLAGEYVSGMIPAFTHNRTLIARDDIAFDYYTKRNKVFKFFDGKMSETEARQFLYYYKVSYILFGIDAQPFEALPMKSFPNLKEIFSSGQLSIVRVDK